MSIRTNSNWFKLWIEEGWKFKRKFQWRGRWTRWREQQWWGQKSGEISKSGEAREKGKPRATMSVKKSSKKRKASRNILSEEEVEELCERLESKRHDLDCEIARKLKSSPNLAFYPSRAALKEAILGDKNVLNEINDEFVNEFIGVIHDVYHTKMTATDKKVVLLIRWSSSWEFVTWINLRFMALSIFKFEPVKLTLSHRIKSTQCCQVMRIMKYPDLE